MGDETPDQVPVDECSVVGDELLEVRRRRYKEAREAGLSFVEAQLFRDSDVDIGQLRRLVEKGCPPRLIAEILV